MNTKQITPENVRAVAELAMGMPVEEALTLCRTLQRNFLAASILVGLGEHKLSEMVDSFETLIDMGKNPPTPPPSSPPTAKPATGIVVAEHSKEKVVEDLATASPPKGTVKRPRFKEGTIKDKVMEAIFLRGDLGATESSLLKLGYREQTIRYYLKDLETRNYITRGKHKGRVYYWTNPNWKEDNKVNNIGFREATQMFTEKLRPFSRDEVKKYVPAERVGQYFNAWEKQGLVTLSKFRTVATPTPKASASKVLAAISETVDQGNPLTLMNLKKKTGAEASVLDETLKYLSEKNLCHYE